MKAKLAMIALHSFSLLIILVGCSALSPNQRPSINSCTSTKMSTIIDQLGAFDLYRLAKSDSYRLHRNDICFIEFSHTLGVNSKGQVYDDRPQLFRLEDLTIPLETINFLGGETYKFTNDSVIQKEVERRLEQHCQSRELPIDSDMCLKFSSNYLSNNFVILRYRTPDGAITIEIFEDTVLQGEH